MPQRSQGRVVAELGFGQRAGHVDDRTHRVPEFTTGTCQEKNRSEAKDVQRATEATKGRRRGRRQRKEGAMMGGCQLDLRILAILLDRRHVDQLVPHVAPLVTVPVRNGQHKSRVLLAASSSDRFDRGRQRSTAHLPPHRPTWFRQMRREPEDRSARSEGRGKVEAGQRTRNDDLCI